MKSRNFVPVVEQERVNEEKEVRDFKFHEKVCSDPSLSVGRLSEHYKQQYKKHF